MRSVSQAFLDAVKTEHRMVSLVVVNDYQGNPLAQLNPVDGQVEIDETAPVHRSFSATFTAPLEPQSGEHSFADLKDLLDPRAGNELKIWRGVHRDSLGTSEDELVALGVFIIANRRIRIASGQVEIQVDGFDRAWKIQQAVLTDAYEVIAGSAYYPTPTVEQVIGDLLQRQAPWVPRRLMVTGTTMPTGIFHFNSGDNPWEKAQELAQVANRELYIDVDGVAVLEDRDSRLGRSPRYSFVDGENLLDLELTDDIEHTWNYIKICGDQSFMDASNMINVCSVAKDTDSASPTRIDGPLRMMPRVINSKKVTNVSLAILLGRLVLWWATGWDEQVEITGLVNPALEPGDRVRARYPKLDVDGVYTIERFTIPLAAHEAMTLSGKRRTK